MSTFGPYEFVCRIAIGDETQVYEAKRQRPDGSEELLAVKRLRSAHAPSSEIATLFSNKARLLALMQHPGIVRAHHFGEIDKTMYVAMELIDGVDLARFLARQIESDMKMPSILAAFIVRQILLALDYAHSHEDPEGGRSPILHGDLCPSNVLISFQGQVKLINFGGISALKTTQQTQIFRSKIHYAAPEQLRGETPDPRADLYSAGVLLYALLTNHRPFEGQTGEKIVQRCARGEWNPFPTLEINIAKELFPVVQRSLKFDREYRHETAEEFISALNRFLPKEDSQQFERRLASYVRLLFGQSLGPRDPKTEEAHHQTDPQQRALEAQKRMEEEEEDNEETSSGEAIPFKSRWLRRGLWMIVFLGILFGGWKLADFFWPKTEKTGKKTGTEVKQAQAVRPIPTARPTVAPTPTPTVSPTPSPRPTATPKPPQKTIRKNPAQPKAAKKEPTLLAFGHVTIFPKGPYATVFINGKLIGNTPILDHRLPVGSHRIRFENEKLGLKEEMTLQINKGDKLRLKDIWKTLPKRQNGDGG